MSRFSIVPVIRGHWKGLTNDRPDGTTKPDFATRCALLVIPLAIAGCTLWFGWQITSPAATLSAIALLSAGLLGVFTQLSGLRVRLTERQDEEWLDVERDGIDEAVAHILFAFILCIATSALLVVGMNSIPPSPNTDGNVVPQLLSKCWSAPILAIASYILLTMFILVPKLYSAYTEMNEVRNELNGFHRSH